MLPYQTGRACPQNYPSGSGMGYDQCMEQCCNPQYGSPPWMQKSGNYQSSYYQAPSVVGRRAEMGRHLNSSPAPNPYNVQSGGGQPASTYPGNLRGPSYDQYSQHVQPVPTFSQHPGGDPCADMWGGQNMGVDELSVMPWGHPQADPSCNSWASMMAGRTPFGSSGGYPNTERSNKGGSNPRRPAPSCPNPQVHQGYSEKCSLKHRNENPGLISRIISKFRPPPTRCPLKPRVAPPSKMAGRGVNLGGSCFRPAGSSRNGSRSDAFDSLDDLWNPRKIRRWGCVNNWDQHKESQWKQVIENKMGTCGPVGRTVENKVHEALDALHQEGADCIAFRMFYGILKRNEDVYLNPYLSLMTDEEFLKLIVALNNFYFEDKDKAKLFLDHPPPSWIEKIMQRETLSILDPNTNAPSIVRRFWEVLLDWYVHKLVTQGDPSTECATSKTASQSSFGSSLC